MKTEVIVHPNRYPNPTGRPILIGWDLAKGDDVVVYRDAAGMIYSREKYNQAIAEKYEKQGAD